MPYDPNLGEASANDVGPEADPANSGKVITKVTCRSCLLSYDQVHVDFVTAPTQCGACGSRSIKTESRVLP